MAGYAEYVDDLASGLDTPPVVPVVYRYDPDADGGSGKYRPLPNVRVASIEFFEDERVPEARFFYTFGDPFADPADPQHIEDCLPVTSSGPRVVLQDDRLVVKVYSQGPDGDVAIMFDGFAQVPQADAQGRQEVVTFMALGVPVREFDDPIAGAIVRDGDDPEQGEDVPTDLVTRFNPGGQPNATPEGFDHGSDGRDGDEEDEDGDTYPVFLDAELDRPPDRRRYWTLGMAARYLLFSRKLLGTDIYKWVVVQTPDAIDALLESRKPRKEGGSIDPSDPDTYTDSPIRVQDLEAQADPWPVALKKLIDPHGFAFRWQLEFSEGGDPEWWVVLYRKDAETPRKQVYLQPAGYDGDPVALDPKRTNAARVSLQRDNRRVYNEVVSDTALTRHEVSVVLAPGFPIAVGDAVDAFALNQFVEGSDNFNPVKYRYFVADETGDGHWDFAAAAMADDPLDLDAVFGGPDADGDRRYVRRRRPGVGRLLTRDAEGAKRKAELWVSANYAGKYPAVWDRTGVWQKVTKGGWEVLDDRLGVKLTRPDLESYSITEPAGLPAGAPFPSGSMRVVSCLANPGAGGDLTTKKFWFLLVTVIQSDHGIPVLAKRRSASPTRFAVRNRVDERTWFKKEVRHKSSRFWANDPTDAITDDTADAQARAEALRKAHELGAVAGSVTVRRFTLAYRVGDRITAVAGRDCSLRQNLGSAKGEAAVYPSVNAIRWDLDGKQETVLSLTDRRADPPPERRR